MAAPKLDRTPSIRERVEDTLHAHRNELVALLSKYVSKGKGILQPHRILDTLDEVQVSGGSALAEGPFLDVLRSSQEAIVLPPFVAIAVRPRPGVWEYVRVNVHELNVEQLSVSEYLRFKEELVDGQHNNPYVLELDFEPFTALIPRPSRSSSIGNGVQFLNRHLSSILFRNRDCLEPLLDFLREHRHKGHVMMLNDRIQSVGRLQSVLTKAEENLSKLPAETPYSQFANQFQEWGLEKGWGDTAEHVLEMIHLLLDILQAPDPSTLETFLGRIPMIFNVVIVSPHGYFGQANVLGMPDTGGQIVYILDQVRALENEMVLRLKKQGLDVTPKILIVTRLIPDSKGTSCNQRLERISGTQHTYILRVPFRNENGILRKWISRFDMWPYLEKFAEDAAGEISAELQGTPDFIIGNYSDGNLVASLLSYKMGITQCNIAHAGSAGRKPARRPRKLPVAASGIVADVIGKGYSRPATPPVSATERSGWKGKGKDMDGESVSNGWNDERNGDRESGGGDPTFNVEEAEQFLCSMLGDRSELSMGVVRDVLGQSGYDVEQALDALLDISGMGWCIPNDEMNGSSSPNIFPGNGLFEEESAASIQKSPCQFPEEIPGMSYNHSERQHEFFWGEQQSSYMKAVCEVQHSETPSPRSAVVDSKMPQRVLESLFKIPERRTYEPSKMDWKKVVKKLQSYNHPITASNQERPKNGDGYREFRGVSARHYDTMKGYYQKAAVAYSKGDKSYASYLAEEGKHYRELGRKEDEKASREIFEARNKHITNTVTIDLHGQHVKQAMKLLKVHMLVCVCMPSTLLRVITGCGVEGTGKGKIKRSVIELVEKEGIEWHEGNSGTIVLRLGGPREYRFLEHDSDSD